MSLNEQIHAWALLCVLLNDIPESEIRVNGHCLVKVLNNPKKLQEIDLWCYFVLWCVNNNTTKVYQNWITGNG